MTPTYPAQPLVQDIAGRVALAAPPGAVVLWNKLAAIPAADWLTYLSIGYLLLQAFVLVRKEFFKRRTRRARK